jgi:hypothetical protein
VWILWNSSWHKLRHSWNFIKHLFIILMLYEGARIDQLLQWLEFGLDDWWVGIQFPVGARDFSFSLAFRPALEPTQPLTYWVTGDLSLGVNFQVCTLDHFLPCIADIKNGGAICQLPSDIFMAWCLINSAHV